MLVRLDDLPTFQVSNISVNGNKAKLTGIFNHLKSVRNGRSWLYAGNAESLIGDLTDLDASNRDAVFTSPWWSPSSPIQIGSLVPWINGYWQAYHVTMIIDPRVKWERTLFEPSDAQHFNLGNCHGWTKLGKRLQDGEIPTHIEKNGWDHEHCELCNEKIGRWGQPYGYLDDLDRWLCEACCERYAKMHSLEFLFDS